MITVSIFGIILTVAVSAGSFMFAIVQTIRFQNAQKMWQCIKNELVEYGMDEEFKKKRYESFERFKTECEN